MCALNRRVLWSLLVAVLLLAALLRFWRLDVVPPGLYHDEAYNGLDALSLLRGDVFPRFYEGWELYAADAHAGREAVQTRWPVFFEGNYGREPLHVYLMAASIAVLGPTPAAVRAVPAAAGVLAVFTTYLAARALFGEEGPGRKATLLPLIAAFFLAILYPALHFSRFGIRAILFLPAATMTVACFWSAVNRLQRRERNGDLGVWFLFAAAGFFVGLGLYTFAAARLFPLVWFVFLPLWFWLDRGILRTLWRQLLLMGFVALLTAAPLLLFFARYPYYFVFRIAYVANKGKGAVEGRPLQTWMANVGRVASGLVWHGETHLRHNLPGRPYLDPLQALFALLGLVYSLRRLLQPRFLFLLIWFAVMLLPSILSGDAPHFGRLVGIAAPASILAAAGVLWSGELLARLLARAVPVRTATRITRGLLALALLWSAALTVRDYFGRYAQHPDLAADFYVDEWQLGRYAAGFPASTRLFLSPAQEELATIYFALGDAGRLRDYDGSDALLPAGTPGAAVLYLLRPGQEEVAEWLRSYFPGLAAEEPGADVEAYHVPAGADRLPAQELADHSFKGQIALAGWSSELHEERLLLTLFWRAQEAMDRDYTAYVHLIGPDGAIAAQLDQQPPGYPTSDWVPGEIVAARFPLPWPEDFARRDLSLRTGFYHLPSLEALGEAAVLGGETFAP